MENVVKRLPETNLTGLYFVFSEVGAEPELRIP